MTSLHTPLNLKFGKKIHKLLEKLGVYTVRDLLYLAPRRYYRWGALTPISSLSVGDSVTIQARVIEQRLLQNSNKPGVRLLVKVTDEQNQLTIVFFAKNAYMLSHHLQELQPGNVFFFAGKISQYRSQLQLVQPEWEEVDLATQAARKAGRPIPVYPGVEGLASWKTAAAIKQLLAEASDKDFPEILPESVRESYGLQSHYQAVQLLHQPLDDLDWQTARRTLAWQEAFLLQAALLTAKRQVTGCGISLTQGGENSLPAQLIRSLPFQLTTGQLEAWQEISQDLAANTPMQRLLQADVGAGKTIVALLALLQTVQAGFSGVLLVPTEVLANQHYRSIARFLANLENVLVESDSVESTDLDENVKPVETNARDENTNSADSFQSEFTPQSTTQPEALPRISLHLLTASQSVEQREQVIQNLASDRPGIVVGTHALLQDSVKVANLGLLVVDEQHRFGVEQREKLRERREKIPHLLVMTATPIPRTIAMSAFGDLDTTRMRGLPPGRQPAQTVLVDNQRESWMHRLWQRAREEIDQGGRLYVICPRIDSGADTLDSAPKAAPKNAVGTDPATAVSQVRIKNVDVTRKPAFAATSKSQMRAVNSPNAVTAPDAAEINSPWDAPAVETAEELLRAEPALQGISIALAHGRQKPAENQAALAAFAAGDSPVLLATTVVEVGVDIPEATMMVVLGAQQFGLATLHQLRGRVGRSNKPSIVMLVHKHSLSSESKKRLQALADTNDGFELAEVDLRLRKEGNILGASQSGAHSGLRFLSVVNDEAIIAAAREQVRAMLAENYDFNELFSSALPPNWRENLVWLERN